VATFLTIGEFSRTTHLSVKALRHYHDVGLLEPAEIDAKSGYRFYATSQVPMAHVIRRLRDLDMPLDQVRSVLEAPNVAARDEVIVSHLEHMEQQLEQTQATVSSLRALLEGTQSNIAVEFRSVGPTNALAVREEVAWDDAEAWLGRAFEKLTSVLDAGRVQRSGPHSALYSPEFFETHSGEVIAFVPTAGDTAGLAHLELLEVPPAHLAVAMHHRSFADLDQTYGALGTFVAERAIGVEGPIREHYLEASEASADPVTEVCWPVAFDQKEA
jgi:DNA-binding transcriptional MerR regulator/effector-binding domain-containing protein